MEITNIINKMVNVYRAVYESDIASIYLYGSYARGDYAEYSDIDFAAIVMGDRMGLQDKLKEVWDISADIGLQNDIIISPTVIPYHEFEEYKEILPYYRNIETEGRIIFSSRSCVSKETG